MIGVIGGSGLASPTLLSEPRDTFTVTPYGAPSGPVVLARHGGVRVAFLARHGPAHRVPAHRVNHRANLWALKEAGADRILATSSVGSLKVPIRPGTFVVPHDFVAFWDIPTYFDEEVKHVTPSIDEALRKVLLAAARTVKARTAPKGVYVQATGPRLETKAEIAFFRTFGDVVGMTVASEATLASELGIPYAALCSVDNYAHGLTAKPLTFREIREMQTVTASASEALLAAALEALR
jgi:5'-deoxy-5'-methylthioadenosine phosphorylase